MPGVSYALADFVTGGPILDLPVLPGASWTDQLNRSDSLSCTVDLRDRDNLALDLRAASEPKKTLLIARTDEDRILAWGLVDDDQEWDEDDQSVSISAKGVWTSYFGKTLIGPATALTSPLTVNGLPNPALDTYVGFYGLGTIGKKIVGQRLTWPGSPVFSLPPDDPGTHYQNYEFAAYKRVGDALTDLTNRQGGPDFAFDATRAPDGLTLAYSMRHGTEANPRIGVDHGSWALGGDSPISGLRVARNASDLGSAVWGSAGKSVGAALASRVLNDSLVTADGYPSLDYVDATRGTVSDQATLDSYTEAAAEYAAKPYRTLSFDLRGDAYPGLGGMRSGDTATIAVPKNHAWLTEDIPIRITSISGDETGESLKIGCVIDDER